MPTKLPIKCENAGRTSEGFCTPEDDKAPQKMRVPPKRLLPIIFLPGIMGSNLRLTPARQRTLGASHNMTWRPDDPARMAKYSVATKAARQLQLDPAGSEVDVYDPKNNPTGDKRETSDQRHSNARPNPAAIIDSPLLFDDPPILRDSKTKEQKARERGWGEVFFGSYGTFLNQCETALNTGDIAQEWSTIVDRDPSDWGATGLAPLKLTELNTALLGVHFPVHAFGYNWLQSNRASALAIKRRIINLLDAYRGSGFQCEKVILVTHSMGGLVARALIHPDIGGMLSKVLGVVHSVMPAIGAPSAYKRMRTGFEVDGGTEFVLGRAGWQVTPVLANSPGALELLPSSAYGNGWLEIRHNKALIGSFPQNGDPYAEIYKRDDCWFKLIREEWLNPAELDTSNLQQTHKYLDDAKKFHEQIDATYHPVSYGHYGTDSRLPSYEKVCWTLTHQVRYSDWQRLHIIGDSGVGDVFLSSGPSDETPECMAKLAPSAGAGDKTVPVRSAGHQLHSKQFRGLFLQDGYEHQGSLQNQKALNSTMYSIARIAQQMTWA